MGQSKYIAGSAESQQKKSEIVTESATQTLKLMLLAGLANCPASTGMLDLSVTQILSV